jgi:hypothetical protein
MDGATSIWMTVGRVCVVVVGTYGGHVGSGADYEDGTYEYFKHGMHDKDYTFLDTTRKLDQGIFFYYGKYSFATNDAKQ